MSEDMRELKERLQEVMRAPVGDLARAEIAAEAGRLLRDLLWIEEQAADLLARASARPDREATGDTKAGTVAEEAPAYGSGSLAGLSLHDAARRTLAAAGAPLHVRDLGARIKAGGWRHPRATSAPPDQIEFQLAARLPRHPSVFRRVAPNTFGLAEWPDRPASRPPQPRVKTVRGHGPPLARRIAEEPDHIFEDEPRWHSS